MELTTPELIFWFALAVFGTVDSALWSGLETALYVVSRLRLESRLHDKRAARSARRLKREIEHPRRALATLLVMNNLSNYVGTLAVATLLDKGTDLPEWGIALISVGVVAPLLFVFAETLPKEIFRTRAEVLAYTLCPILTTVRRILTAIGVVPAVLALTRIAERALGGAPIQTDEGERIRAILQEATGAGVLSEEQSKLLDRASAFGETTAADEMIPWARVSKLRDSMTIETAAAAAVAARVSRLPLIDRRGEPVGVVRTIDLLLARKETTAAIRDLAAPAPGIDADTAVPDALAQLHATGSPLAIIKKSGKPVGIVTVKDLVEPLTGDLDAW